jgi:hypothetical protein
VLQGAAETELALANAMSFAPEGRTLHGVSFRMADPLTVVESEGGPIPASADASRMTILDGGGMLVVPGDPISATSWWEVTTDGATRSVLSPDLGGNWLSGIRNPFRKVRPVQPQQGTRKKGGDEKTLLYTIEEEVTPTVSNAAGHAVRDGFETAAQTAAKATAKKIIGG